VVVAVVVAGGDIPLIEDSDFFTSFSLSGVSEDKGLIYYPVSDSVHNGFISSITASGYIGDGDPDDECYEKSGVSAYACSGKTNGKYALNIWQESSTVGTISDDDIANFFPKIEATLSARYLTIYFNGNKYSDLQSYGSSLGFTSYDDGTDDTCWKNEKEGLIYSYCYYADTSYSDATWSIYSKELFNTIF
jgi:hypothetical protein